MEARFVSGHRVELLVPRPPFSYHDRTECLSVPGVMRICTDGLVEAQHTGFFTANFKINGTRLYAVRQKAIYSQKLHRKWSPQNSAFLFRVSLATLGNASYSLSQQLFHPSTMEELLHSETKSVHIDPETRRPSKLPSWIVKDYHQFANHEPSLISVKQVDFIPPSDSFQTTIRTRHSDMDSNGHVHFAEFYRFCADCASEASLSGFYRHYDDELGRYPVLETDVTFIGESPPSSNLTVSTWQDNSNVQRIYFAIDLKNNKIFQASYLYRSEKFNDKTDSKL